MELLDHWTQNKWHNTLTRFSEASTSDNVKNILYLQSVVLWFNNVEIEWLEQIVEYLEASFKENELINKKYREYNKHKNFPLKKIFYFLLEWYNIFLNIWKIKWETLLTKIEDKQVQSPKDLNFPSNYEWQISKKDIKINVINDNLTKFHWHLRTFINNWLSESSIIINKDNILKREKELYKPIFWKTDYNSWFNSTVAHEFTRLLYSLPKSDIIEDINWNFLNANNHKEIEHFLAEYSNFYEDNRKIYEWFWAFCNDITVDEHWNFKTIFWWDYAFTYNIFFNILKNIFQKKWIDIKKIIINGEGINELLKNIHSIIGKDDLEEIKNELWKIQTLIFEKIENQ